MGLILWGVKKDINVEPFEDFQSYLGLKLVSLVYPPLPKPLSIDGDSQSMKAILLHELDEFGRVLGIL